MNDEDVERIRLENELRQTRRRERGNARGTRFVIFLAIWIVPLITIKLFGGNEEGRAASL